MVTAEELKNITKIGDEYELYYGNGTRKKIIGTKIEVNAIITRFNEKSVWHKSSYNNSESRQSWNTFAGYMNTGCYRRI